MTHYSRYFLRIRFHIGLLGVIHSFYPHSILICKHTFGGKLLFKFKSYHNHMQEKIHQYTKAILDNVTSMISDKLGTPKPEIPKSMEAPYMRLVLLPEYEGYPAGTHVSKKYLAWDWNSTVLFSCNTAKQKTFLPGSTQFCRYWFGNMKVDDEWRKSPSDSFEVCAVHLVSADILQRWMKTLS